MQILGVGHRVGISLLGGGGYAWTSPENTVGSLITGSNTTIFTDTDGFGNTTTVTTTRQITKEQTSFAAFEAGIRGTWRILPKWTLDLTIRQLWATASSVRDMKLTIDTSSGSIATNMNTPVSGVATGLGIRYTF